MTTIQRSALVPYPAEAMFELVNAVEAYPQFMEGCAGATVIERTNEYVEARLDLSKSGLRYSFTTRNRLLPHQRIELSLVEGPFDSFQGAWGFQPLGEHACKISLHLQFELSGRLLNFAARKMFDSVANQMVDALVKRAHVIHGGL
ncbi:MAG TPA: type II toxin-antitoxin system RatA family toxin [Spongiibacteraceae bacterium]|nr:type II toxin-antitoxin system RatA family toxin [Spongiibacteraceae bacterium]